MKHIGLSDYEWRERDTARRERNSSLALMAIVILGSIFLGWTL